MEASSTTTTAAGDPVVTDAPAEPDTRDQQIDDLKARVAELEADEAAEDGAAVAGYVGPERRVAADPRRQGPEDRRAGAAVEAPADAAAKLDPMGAPVEHNPAP